MGILFNDLSLGWYVRTNGTHLIDLHLLIWRVSFFRKPWFHITKMSNKVGFIGTYPTNSQCLAKDYRMLGVFWMQRCVMEKLVTVCRFNKQICRYLPSNNLTFRSRKAMSSLFVSWVNLILGWLLIKSSKNNLSFSWPWFQIKKTSSMYRNLTQEIQFQFD